MTNKTKTSAHRSSKTNTQGLFSRILLRLGSLSTNAWMVILTCVVLESIGLYFAYRQYLIIENRKQFQTAEIVIDQLYDEILLTVGEPTTADKSKSCSYASTKFSRGRRGCWVGYRFEYVIKDTNAANIIRQKINELLRTNPLFIISFERDSEFIPGRDSIPGDEPSYEMLDNNNIDYSVGLEYYDPTNGSNYDIPDYTVVISLGHGGNAQAEYYPVRD